MSSHELQHLYSWARMPWQCHQTSSACHRRPEVLEKEQVNSWTRIIICSCHVYPDASVGNIDKRSGQQRKHEGHRLSLTIVRAPAAVNSTLFSGALWLPTSCTRNAAMLHPVADAFERAAIMRGLRVTTWQQFRAVIGYRTSKNWDDGLDGKQHVRHYKDFFLIESLLYNVGSAMTIDNIRAMNVEQ